MKMLIFVVLVCFIVFSNGEYWEQLGENGDRPARPRLQAAGAYCDKLDIMLMYGGRRNMGSIYRDIYVYDFKSATWTNHSPLMPDEMEGRFGSVVTSIDPHPDFPNGCRFVIYGGDSEINDRDTKSNRKVWLVQINNITSLDINEIVTSNDPPRMRAGASGTSFGPHSFVFGGVRSTGGNDIVEGDMFRLSLNDTLPWNQPQGKWLQVYRDGQNNRFVFGHARMGNYWVVYGGQGKRLEDRNDVIRSSMLRFDLSTLAIAGGISGQAEQEIRSEQTFYRMRHVCGALGNRLFVYGGQRLVTDASRRNSLQLNGYVSLTDINFETRRQSCTSSDGVSSSWCGFAKEFPGISSSSFSVQRQTKMVIYRFDDDDDNNYLNALDLDKVSKSGNLGEGRDFETNFADLWGMRSLQYSLIAVCIFLLISLFALFRHRSQPPDFTFQNSAPKKTGITPEQVDALDLVRYDPNGNHILVKRDKNGNEIERKDVEDEATALKSGDKNNNNEEEEEEEVCAICILEFEKNEVLKQLPCKHLYHEECIDPWLLKRGTCPLCKRHVIRGVKVDEDGEEEIDQDSSAQDSAPVPFPSLTPSSTTTTTTEQRQSINPMFETGDVEQVNIEQEQEQELQQQQQRRRSSRRRSSTQNNSNNTTPTVEEEDIVISVPNTNSFEIEQEEMDDEEENDNSTDSSTKKKGSVFVNFFTRTNQDDNSATPQRSASLVARFWPSSPSNNTNETIANSPSVDQEDQRERTMSL